MDRIYDDACDKNVAAVVVYINSGSYYYDAAFTKAVPATDMLNLFLKGVVFKNNDTYVKAIACTEAGVVSFAS